MTSCDAAVVLGCAVRDGEPSLPMRQRVRLGARIYHAGLAPRVVASGGRRWRDSTEALVMARLLAEAGVPASEVLVELCSLTTAENAFYTASMMRARGWRRVIVASCGWHLPRALAAFRRCGVEAVAPPAEWIATPPPGLAIHLRERLCGLLDAAVLAGIRR